MAYSNIKYLNDKFAAQSGRYQTEAGRARYGFPFYQYPTQVNMTGGLPPGWKLDETYGWFKVPAPPLPQALPRRPSFGGNTSACCGVGAPAQVLPDRSGGDLAVPDFYGAPTVNVGDGGGGLGNLWRNVAGAGNPFSAPEIKLPPSQDELSDTSPFITGKEVLKAIIMALIVSTAIYFLRKKAL